METNKHPTEIIKELDYEIDFIEKKINHSLNELQKSEDKLIQLKHRKQSIINYLNEEHE